MRIIAIIILSIIFKGCETQPKEDIAYNVINDILVFKHKLRLNSPMGNNIVPLDTLFVNYNVRKTYTNNDSKNPFDLYLFNLEHESYISNFQNCKEFDIKKFQIEANKEYYLNQINSLPNKIDFSKIETQNFEPYHNVIREKHNRKSYEMNLPFFKDEATKRRSKQSYINKENGSLGISYPIFSKNLNHAMILERNESGVFIWFLELSNGLWEKQCELELVVY